MSGWPRNLDSQPHSICLTVQFQTDFADLFEVRGHQRAARGRTSAAIHAPHAIVFTYEGLAGGRQPHDRAIRARANPARGGRGGIRAVVAGAGARVAVFQRAGGDGDKVTRPRAERFFFCLRDARRALRTSSSRAAAVETSNNIFNETLCRSVADLYMLVTDTAEGPYPYADSLVLHGVRPRRHYHGHADAVDRPCDRQRRAAVSRGDAGRGAAARGRRRAREDPARDPARRDGAARRGALRTLLWAVADATPLFVMLAGLYYERTGDLDTIRALAARPGGAALIDEFGDRDGDGFVEYAAPSASAA